MAECERGQGGYRCGGRLGSGICREGGPMKAQVKTRRMDPTGRLDVAVFNVLDRLLERYLPKARNVVTTHERELRALLAKHMGPRNKRARLVRDVVRKVQPLMLRRATH
jgi:hypothetical protein